MSARVRVTVDEEGAVALKHAATPADLDRLRIEADRLTQADHPGVVTFLGHEATVDEGELRTRFAGEPLERWHGSLESVAGLGAAVASTLADLHAAGIIHGRLDASHVLVGVDGRPRMCGLSGREAATAADDVADLAKMLSELAEHAAPSRKRRGGATRRALRDVLDDARDPVATRRPSARTLADALASIPGAGLPTAPERFPLQAPRTIPEVDDQRRGADRSDPAMADAASMFDEFWSPTSDLVPFGPDFWAGDEAGSDSHRGGAVEADGAASDAPEAARSLPPTSDADTTAERPLLAGRPPSPPSPIAPPSHPSRRRASRLAVGGGALIGLTILGAIAAFAVGGRAPATEAAGPSTPTTSPVPIADRSDCPPVEPPAADVDGDGCEEPIRVDDRTVTAGDASWSLGEPGDLVAVGDWDCDGGATPALLRPTTGEVFVFPGWARPDDPVTIAATEQVAGGVAIAAQRDGACDRIAVELAAGGTTTIDVSEVPR